MAILETITNGSYVDWIGGVSLLQSSVSEEVNTTIAIVNVRANSSYGIVHHYCKVQPRRGYIRERELLHEG